MANRKIGYFCYNTFLALASLFLAAMAIFRVLANYQSRRSFFNNISGISKPIIWIHAATEGQLTYAHRVLKSLEAILSDYQPILTYTGKESAQTIQLTNSNFLVTVLPYSIELFPKQILSRIKPRLFLMVEDCFYPNQIRLSKEAGSKVALINGRVNHRLVLVHRVAPAFLKAIFEQIDPVIMESVDEANRIGQLGAELSSILVSDSYSDRDEGQNGFETNGHDAITKTVYATVALLRRNF